MVAILIVSSVAAYFLANMNDYENTINHGYPADAEYEVNFWTRKRPKVSGNLTDKLNGRN